MMVAGFRGTLYRSYEFPPLPPPLASHECAMCEQQNPRCSGENIPGGGFHPLLTPRDPGQTNDGQFTSNRKNFLKLGLKWVGWRGGKAERKREKSFSQRPPNYPWDTRGFYFILETVTGVKWANTVLGPGLPTFIIIFLSVDEGGRHYFQCYASTKLPWITVNSVSVCPNHISSQCQWSSRIWWLH